MSNLLTNTVIIDNASEALYEIIEEGAARFDMLLAEAIDKEGNKYQIYLSVTSNEDEFIENSEGMPVFEIDDDYRICKEI
jgi:hypothetical protein